MRALAVGGEGRAERRVGAEALEDADRFRLRVGGDLATRSGLVAKRGSAASSGSPIAPTSRRKSPSFAAVIISPPSAAGKTWYGAIAWKPVPCGAGTDPVSIVPIRW